MAQYKFKLKLDIPEIYPDNTLQQIRLRCHDSDGLDHCDCVKVRKHRGPERCCFFGRPIEPLAFYLPPYAEVQQQPQSPLYGLLPKEVRIAIFEFALTDDSALTAGRDNIFRWQIGTDADVPKPDVAHALLQTCKAVYLEAYRLPMQLNGYQSYRHRGRSRPNLERICPWQYALIQRLDLSLQQVSIEGQDLEHALADWRPMTRHLGAYVAPRHYNKRCPEDRPAGIVQAHSFGLLQPFEDAKSCIHDGDEITLPQGQAATCDQYPQDYPTLFTARAMLARSITHLTLRISRTDWWTWSDDPDTEDNDKQLALDPACGTHMRPLVSDMLHLAESRRLDQHPVYESTWGASVGALQDLQTFELVLETFSVKKRQLDAVVTCSQTWRFPLQGTRYELAHDGKVTSLNWAGVACTGEASADDSELEPIGLPEYSPRSEYGDDDIGDRIPPISPIPSEGSDSGAFPRGLYYWDRDRRFSDTSFVSNHDLWPYHFDHFPDEPWIKDAHEFEVRIVRYRRRTRIH